MITLDLTAEMLARFEAGMQAALDANIPEANAMTLATVDPHGQPAARTVLLKHAALDGFVFYTNLGSRKGRHLSANDKVSLVFWWRENEQQVLVDGRAMPVSDAEADAYFASRPRGSQIGAWASIQSTALDSRETLVARVAEVEARFDGQDVPRPSHWSGFRVHPHRLEFWYGKPFRLHERICFTASDQGWQSQLLFP